MFIKHISRATLHLLLWISISAALTLNIVRFFLADIATYKPEVEQKIRQITLIPVHIGDMKASIRFFSPSIVLHRISIDTVDDGNPLQLQEIRIGFDLLKLLLSRDPIAATKVTMTGVQIEVARQKDGKITIKGLQPNLEFPYWLLKMKEYTILHSDILWQDMSKNGKHTRFTNASMILKNRDQQHEIHFLTKLPENYGKSLRISASFSGHHPDLNHLEGILYFEGTDLQAAALTENGFFPEIGIESGSGNVKIWSQWRQSRPYLVAGYLQARQIKIMSSATKPIALDSIAGNFSWNKTQEAWRLGTYNFNMAVGSSNWTDGELYLRRDIQGNWSALIKRMDLQAAAYLAPLLAMPEFEQGSWLQTKPTGQLNDFRFFAQADLRHYALQGNFRRLGIDTLDLLPGLNGLTGQINGNDSGGYIKLMSNDMQIESGDIFRNSLNIRRMNGKMIWRQSEDSWLFEGRRVQIDSPDFQTETNFNLTLHKDGTSPDLYLRTSFENIADVSRLSAYFPVKYMNKDAIHWMDQAFISGQIKQGELTIRGRLDQFPFENGQGLFESLFSIENGELQYHPAWPRVKALNADFHYLGKDLQVAIQDGSGEQVDIKQILVTINNLPDSESAVVTGQLQGKLQNELLFLQKTPLHTYADSLLKRASLDGPAQIDLMANIPYNSDLSFHFDTAVHLNSARFTFLPIDLVFKQINGVLHFTENGIYSNDLTANTLGYPVQAAINNDNALRLSLRGSTDSANLQKKFSFLQNDFIKGKFAYQAELNIPTVPGQPQSFLITSNLEGLSIDGLYDLNLNKIAADSKPLKIDFKFGNQPMPSFKLRYGNELKAAFLLDTNRNQLYAGDIVLGREGETETPLQAGLKVKIAHPEFKLSHAVNAFEANGGNYWPPLQEITLKTNQLLWQGLNLGAIQCHFRHNGQIWQGDIDSSMEKGRLSIPDLATSNEPIKLDMEYLNLTAMSSLHINAAQEALTNLPLIDIDSRHLVWRTVDLGKLKLQSERLNKGVHFKTIKLSSTNKDIHFTADWIKQIHGTSTLLSGSLTMDGFGQFLAELGYSNDIKETHASINLTGGWDDAPQNFSLDKLNGQLHVKLRDGRISSIEPGFGRLLGLIAMEQWVKRLSLDFSDLYREGLAFNSITGDFKITNGIAYTDNLLIDAVPARLKVSGSAGLEDKSLDQVVAVLPKSSDALPIAGTIVGGIAEIITNALTDDYRDGYFFGSEYKIAGHWGNVEVTQVTDHSGLLSKTWNDLTGFDWLK